MRNAAVLLTLLLIVPAIAADDTTHPYDAAFSKMRQQIADTKKRFTGDANVLIADGIISDRAARTVTLLACATGVSPSDPVEFFVAPFDSGKDYESLAITEAKPSAVRKALEFIGLKPGRPIDFEKNIQWARGPRVTMTFTLNGQRVRAEDLIVDAETKAPLPRSGLIFAGSFTRTDETGQHLAADVVDARPIAPDFNDPAAVLDVPARVNQSAIYGRQRPSADHPMNKGDLVEITLSPAPPEEAVADPDLFITAAMQDGRVAYTLSDEKNFLSPASDTADLPHLVNAIAPHLDGKTDWFTHVKIAPAVKVNDVRKLFGVLMAMEKDRALKLEPSGGQNLFHRAYFPDEQWRQREGRLGEPWELFLERKDGALSGRLERVIEADAPASTQPNKVEVFPVATPAELDKALRDHASQWSKAIFVYPPADLSDGEITAWVGPVLKTYPHVFVFRSEPEKPAATP